MIKHTNQAGFTLIEALIAMVVLAAGLAAIANLFVVAGSTTSVANKSSAATAQATEAMERLKAIPFLQLAAGGSVFPAPAAPPMCAAVCNDGVALNNCVRPGNFAMCKSVTAGAGVGVNGVGQVRTLWSIVTAETRNGAAGAAPSAYYITVQSDVIGPFGGNQFAAGGRSQALFSTLRVCTTAGCPGL